ncbi:MAG: hypothetical protein AAF902_15830 [Chloroflexota bacterium]
MLPESNQQLSLKLENATAFVDFDTRLFYIQYGKIIEAEVTAQVYEWMKAGATSWFNEEDFRGGVFDFRSVEKFAFGNTVVAQQASQEVNEVADYSILPLALIVNNVQQATRVRMSMRQNDTRRKGLVFSEEKALEFINSWNKEHNRLVKVEESLLMAWPSYTPGN